MKKTCSTKAKPKPDAEMLAEYNIDYSKARPNRFAGHAKHGTRAIILDPDVAAVFSSAEAVNAVLRALIENMPRKSAS